MVPNTIVTCADSSGAFTARIIKIKGKTRKQSYAYVGDIVTIVVQTVRANRRVKKGDIKKALVIRSPMPSLRRDGSSIKFDNGAVVIMHPNRKNQPLATRIFGPVSHELRKLGYAKIISLGLITL